ncbi:hypothetical protein ACUHMQ_01745 [Chitinimonas sp. PSY-7]|uniref:hypothetical protein n=1 Tax=Chitinimonas sp. PSY-7 TaxID=3459088 RepID=UPI00403FE12B
MTAEELAQATYSATIHALNNLEVSRFLNSRQQEVRYAFEQKHPNPLVRASAKYFSQNGEDGIILEIIKRFNLARPWTFVEFGVGNGLENNTVNMLIHGHRGAWVGGEDLAITIPQNSNRLFFNKAWITAENANELFERSCTQLGTNHIDLFSLDVDGVDIYILEALLKTGKRPSVIICEYNGKFPPPINFRIAYNPQHQWDGTDYFGASVTAFDQVLSPAGYTLAACNISGVNAFFIENSKLAAFQDIPKNIEDIYINADYGYLYRVGHPPSAKTIERFL